MAKIRNIIWWLTFLCTGIILQVFIPRLDALVIGAIITLEEKDYKTMVWLLPCILILQEGMGTQNFGATVLWLASFFMLYKVLAVISSASTVFFILILSLCLGAVHGLIYWLFATLQGFPFVGALALHDSIIQAVYIPPAWLIFSRLRRLVKHEDKKEES